jgi:hypothetical protein
MHQNRAPASPGAPESGGAHFPAIAFNDGNLIRINELAGSKQVARSLP